jgi:hypothetical protein
MKLFKAILLLTLFAPGILFAQTYSELIAKGDAYYKDKDFLNSANQYEAAFKIKEGTASHYYNAACSWALSGEKEMALDNLEKSITKGWLDIKWMNKDADLTSLHEEDRWVKLNEQLQAKIDEIESKYNQPLKEELEAIYIKDQMLRQMLDCAEEKFGKGSDEIKYFWGLINDQDQENEKRVLEIIDEHGWPGKSLVGGKANTTVWLVIQHAPLEIQEKYLPLLEASVKEGESRGSNLALLQDRVLMRQDKKQIYGSQIRTDQETGEMYVYPIEDPENVNKRRAEVGLGTIEEYAKRFGIDYKPGEH